MVSLTPAMVQAITGKVIHIQRMQASRAVITITAVCQCHYGFAAVGAGKTSIFIFSAHTVNS